MQSDGNRFCGDVVLDNFNKASWDEDNISDQIYKSKYVRIFFMVLIIYNIIRKCLLRVALKPIFMSSLFPYVLYFFIYAFNL